MKKLTILGSTGSIGKQTLEIVKENPDLFQVQGLTCNTNTELLEKQIKEFNPKYVCVMDKDAAYKLESNISNDIKVLSGLEGLIKISKESKCDILLTAVVGSVGLLPTYEAIKCGIDIALANKETLVTAGQIIMAEAKKSGSKILPVDSEHSAIFQCLQGNKMSSVEKVILTASGGTFLNTPIEELKTVRPEDALKHPNWEMGKKITIDSATMMNKGLEVIEAKWLFDMSIDQIGVVIHPESIIHSMVQYKDSSVISQMGLPDMKLPILYALNYPERMTTDYERLDLAKIGQLNFLEPDLEKFKALELAYESIKIGHSMPVVLNTANEIYVKKFLDNEIKFLDIVKYVEKEMKNHDIIKNPTIEEIIKIENEMKERLI